MLKSLTNWICAECGSQYIRYVEIRRKHNCMKKDKPQTYMIVRCDGCGHESAAERRSVIPCDRDRYLRQVQIRSEAMEAYRLQYQNTEDFDLRTRNIHLPGSVRTPRTQNRIDSAWTKKYSQGSLHATKVTPQPVERPATAQREEKRPDRLS